MVAGPGVSERFQLDLSGIDSTTHILTATCYTLCQGERCTAKRGVNAAMTAREVRRGDTNGDTISVNEILMAPPKDLKLPAAHVSAVVASHANADGTIDVHVNATATALFVT